MGRLPKKDLEALGISADSAVANLSEVQVRKLIAKCAHVGAVRYTGHAEKKLVERGGTREDVLRCLKQGAIVPGKSEPSTGGGLKLVLRHLYCGDQLDVVVALDAVAGPSFVITVFFEA